MRTATLMGAAALTLIACSPKKPVEAAPDAAVSEDMPVPGAPKAYTPPAPVRSQLKSGVPVYTITDDSLPLVSVQLTVPTGSAMDPPGKYGRAALGASMLGEGAGERTALQQASALEALAATVRFGLRREATTLSIDVHADRLEAVLPLAADALLRPRFDAEDWARVQQQHLTLLEASLDDNREVAGLVGTQRWWGEGHGYGTPSDGTLQTAGALTLADVKGWHAEQLHSNGAAFVVVGDVTSERATELLDAHFGEWNGLKRTLPALGDPAAPKGILLVDRPGSTQTVFNVILAGQTSTDDNRASYDVATVIMGGSFTSRFNRRLREELGYTYGARMGQGRMQGGGVIRVGTSIRGDATADALKETVALLQAAHDEGFTADEVARGRAQVLSNVVDGVETRGGLAGRVLSEILSGRSPEDLGAWIRQVDTIDEASVDAAGKALDPGQALIVLVGDRSQIEGPLREAGFTDITVVEADGSDVE